MIVFRKNDAVFLLLTADFAARQLHPLRVDKKTKKKKQKQQKKKKKKKEKCLIICWMIWQTRVQQQTTYNKQVVAK